MMGKEISRKNKVELLHDSILNIERGTKKKSARVTFAISEELAQKLIDYTLVKMNYFNSDFPVVALQLHWTEVEYEQGGVSAEDTV